jgi:hypothetical protein
LPLNCFLSPPPLCLPLLIFVCPSSSLFALKLFALN